ncbi:MAG: hypothetical protein ACLTKG_03965 [Collinsella intestinalis]
MVEKPRRYQPLGVAKTAYEIARAYDVDCFSAALVGFGTIGTRFWTITSCS